MVTASNLPSLPEGSAPGADCGPHNRIVIDVEQVGSSYDFRIWHPAVSKTVVATVLRIVLRRLENEIAKEAGDDRADH